MDFLHTLQQTNELASLPTVASKLLSLLEDDNADLRTIARYIEQDVAIASKVVRVANSPMFGLRVPVASIPHAIMTIGTTRVTNIVLGVSIFSKFVYLSTLAGSFLSQFWTHSAVTASLARSLVRQAKVDFQEMEFLAGLIHDIGKLAMLQIDVGRFRTVQERMKEGCPELQAELEVFGATHTEAGEVICNMWKLPATIQGVVRLHHEANCSISDVELLLSVVQTADALACEFGYSYGETMLHSIDENPGWNRLKAVIPAFSQWSSDTLCEYVAEDVKSASTLITVLTTE
ncbi:MAG: HDOD domain-containing protein [Bacteroidota bacterium]|nr:HDOD domain-containing protein [Candidatus Kapabacteria bacterium]MCS7302658.1 HDOD domain-containing protein [Candidatus Kapabacteria bacterium]MCX7936227.1 HDOD domain-containing protein [Chlorobiota bacterium]MDW8074492.1 HDOD domain-containing protein [Bacteroidota bacterium]MDW8271032.1 HDOD domain-containing protein [Bacteroidota bacterium]